MLCDMPEPENIGSFWPLTSVNIPSMTETPVWIKSLGYSRCSGFIGSPFMSKNLEAIGSGSPSIGLPSPSNTLPKTSSDTGISITFPMNLALVPETERPVVPSKTWTIALPLPTSSTFPNLLSPSVV